MGTLTEQRFHSIPFSLEKEAQSFEREQLIIKPLSRVSLLFDLALCLSLLEKSSRKRWKRGLQPNRRYFKLFYTQSGAYLTQWLVTEKRNVNIASRSPINHLSTKATYPQLLRACVPAVAVFSCVFLVFNLLECEAITYVLGLITLPLH